MKPQTAWAIAAPNGDLYTWTVRRTSRESITIITSVHSHSPWQELERCGYRCVRVRIEVIEQEGEG